MSVRETTTPFFAGTVVRGCRKAILVFAKRKSPKHSTRMMVPRFDLQITGRGQQPRALLSECSSS